MKGTQQGSSTLLDIAVMAVIVELSLIVILFASVPPADAATRVFYDGFESGNVSLWDTGGTYIRCQVVTSSTDGVAGPFAGTHMARCNWNGTVDWQDPLVFESLALDTSNYSNEVFMRFKQRPDQNLDRSDGSPTKILRIFAQNPVTYEVPNDIISSYQNGSNSLKNEGTAGGAQMVSYWGSAADHSGESSGWHEVEYYFNAATGKVRVWHDGLMIRDDTFNPGFAGTKWSPLNIASNWADAHDAVNHVYFDDVEIFSDSTTGTGTTGSMADGTIAASGTPPPPTALLFDDFEDSVMDWEVDKGDWTESGGVLTGVGDSKATAFASVPWSPSGAAGCSSCTIKVYDIVTQGGDSNKIKIIGLFTDGDNKAEVIFKEEGDKVTLKQFVDGETTKETAEDVLIEPNIPFDAEVSFDGSNIEVIVNGVSVLTVPAEGLLTGKVGFQVKNTTGSFGQITVE